MTQTVSVCSPSNRGPGRRPALLATCLASLTLLLAACASVAPSTPEDIVRQRAETRWAALIKQDYKQAYDYMTPSYRAVVSPDQFRGNFGQSGQWTNAIVHAVTCEAESCDVQVRITTKVNVPKMAIHFPEVTTYMHEKWVREDGQWWRYEAI